MHRFGDGHARIRLQAAGSASRTAAIAMPESAPCYGRVMITRRRWVAGWALLAGTYLLLGLVGVVRGEGLQSAVVHLVTATVTFGFAAAVLPVVVPRGRDHDDDDWRDDPGRGDPPPPWWPEFERQFWGYVQRPIKGQGKTRELSSRERTPTQR